jgi:chemotaxis protein methyltransferase CheR
LAFRRLPGIIAAMHDVDPIDLVDTIREGLLVLEPDLTVRFANRFFCKTFAVAQEDTVGWKLYELGNGQWDIPELRSLIQTIISEQASVEAFEVDQVFPSIGRRVMLLNARKVYRAGGNKTEQILLAIEDVTERVQLERERSVAHQRIEMLLQELTHRVKNSLQTIASIVRIEAGRHKSGEGKGALERVSDRISAIGRLYSNLEKAGTIEAIDASIYLEEVCANLIASVQQRGGKAISLKTDIARELLSTERTIPIGLIVNELVMNAIKYAFPDDTGGTVNVALKRESGELRLTVADDGRGAAFHPADSGLGSRLVEGFAQQLGGRVERESGNQGTTVRLILPSPGGS